MAAPDSAKPMARDRKDTAGVQSIETGVALLGVLARSDGPMKLSGLAAASGMSTSRAHKYLASFIRCGLVRQSQPSGRYGMGALAAELGFAALRNMDVVELAQDTLDDLRDRLQTVVSFAVWANRGPTIIRRAVHEQSVSLVVQLGGVMTMLTSAGGLVFCAWLDRAVTDTALRRTSAMRAGILPGQRDDCGVRHPYTLQATQTDHEFLSQRAREIGFEVAVLHGRLDFPRPPPASRAG